MENIQESFSQINELLSQNPKGLTVNEISEGMGVNRNTVAKYLEVMLALGEVEMKQYGPAKVWFYSPGISLNTLMDYSTSMIAVVDDSLEIKRINSTFLAFLGKEEDEVLEARATEIFSMFNSKRSPGPEGGFDIEEVLLSTLSGVANEIEELEIPTAPDERRRIVSLKVYPTVFGGREKGLAIICDDITEKTLYGMALEESEELFHTVFYGAHDGMAIVQEGLFILMNEPSEAILGIDPNEAMGKPLESVMAPEHKKEAIRWLESMVEEGQEDQRTLKVVDSEGSKRTLEFRGSSIRYNTKPAHLLIFKDVSDS